jgi:hypothetical protein
VCVPFLDCEFTKVRRDSILNEEIILEIRNRSEACSKHGPKLICCENDTNKRISTQPPKSTTRLLSVPTTRSKRSTTTRSTKMTSKSVFSPTISWRQASTSMTSVMTQRTTLKPSTTDPVLHQNYKFFKDLKCGSSSSNKIANGKVKS